MRAEIGICVNPCLALGGGVLNWLQESVLPGGSSKCMSHDGCLYYSDAICRTSLCRDGFKQVHVGCHENFDKHLQTPCLPFLGVGQSILHWQPVAAALALALVTLLDSPCIFGGFTFGGLPSRCLCVLVIDDANARLAYFCYQDGACRCIEALLGWLGLEV
jgi:hypothetical protein